ncbi:hypothetical protein CYMTET_28669, partial [Cymbomonas tetramitiformis]
WLLALLEASVYDPLVEWSQAHQAEHERRGMETVVAGRRSGAECVWLTLGAGAGACAWLDVGAGAECKPTLAWVDVGSGAECVQVDVGSVVECAGLTLAVVRECVQG